MFRAQASMWPTYSLPVTLKVAVAAEVLLASRGAAVVAAAARHGQWLA